MADGVHRHKDFSYTILRIGHENIPIIVVDHVLGNFEDLIAYAKAQPAFTARRAGYPGICGTVPKSYFQSINTLILPIVVDVYRQSQGRVAFDEADFSVVATSPDDLAERQRIPHKDGTDPIELAMIHYLCDDSFGGTSFYRHRRTGYEYIDASRAKIFDQELNRELQAVGLPHPSGYMNGNSALFERTHACTAKLNRAVIYPCPILHSGDISNDYLRGDEPGLGRLTITGFFSRHR